MKRLIPLLLVVAVLCSTSACYHAKIVTGLTPSNKVIDDDWAVGVAFGLAILEEYNVQEECPNGVAIVETELSFLNQVAYALTGGLFSPMSVKITCAAAPANAQAKSTMSFEEVQLTLHQAAMRSQLLQKPLYVTVVK